MIINTETGIESSLPLQKIWDYKIDWTVNRHAELKLTGEVNPGELEKLSRRYVGTGIELFFINESGEKEETIFNGIVSSVQFHYESGSCKAVIKGCSSSKLLDSKRDSHSFQDVSKTYADIAKSVMTDEGGAVICTSGKYEIEKPLIRYKETAWEYVQRIASLCHTYLIADIITGRPNVWFGMRKGVKIAEDIGDWDGVEVLKKYGLKEGSSAITNYQMSSRKRYCIGDYKEIEGTVCTIYKVVMEYNKGELIFQYMLAKESELAIQPYFNEDFIGLNLYGKISRTENENVYINLDMDGEDGMYPYPWKPETGNAFYAMPEIGTPVSLHISGVDEREAFGITCLHQKGSLKYRDSDTSLKELETVFEDKINLFPDKMEFSKYKEHSLEISDGTGVLVTSAGEIRMEAEGKVQLQAKQILVTVPEEIKGIVS